MDRLCWGLGLRRVDWVRVVVADGTTTCEVVGSGHRAPCRRRVPLSTALALRARGVPTFFRTTDRDAAAPTDRTV